MKGQSGWPACDGDQSSVGTGSRATTGCPFRRARNGTVARTCRVIPRHRVVGRLCMAFSKKILLGTTPELAANSATSLRTAKAAGPARPNVSWLSGTNRHAPVLIRLCLSCSSEPFPLAIVPMSCRGLDSRRRQRVLHTYIRYDRTALEQCQQVTPLGAALGAGGGRCCAAAWPRAARG